MAAAVGAVNLREADVLDGEAAAGAAVHGAAVVERAAEVVHLGADVEGEVERGQLELELDELDDRLRRKGGIQKSNKNANRIKPLQTKRPT